jgi:hypothetical protein
MRSQAARESKNRAPRRPGGISDTADAFRTQLSSTAHLPNAVFRLGLSRRSS